MIQGHGLDGTVASRLRAMAGRQAREAGVDLPLARLWAELEPVREVVNVFAAGAGDQDPREQAVLKKRARACNGSSPDSIAESLPKSALKLLPLMGTI